MGIYDIHERPLNICGWGSVQPLRFKRTVIVSRMREKSKITFLVRSKMHLTVWSVSGDRHTLTDRRALKTGAFRLPHKPSFCLNYTVLPSNLNKASISFLNVTTQVGEKSDLANGNNG
jgi:hypothetical protein